MKNRPMKEIIADMNNTQLKKFMLEVEKMDNIDNQLSLIKLALKEQRKRAKKKGIILRKKGIILRKKG